MNAEFLKNLPIAHRGLHDGERPENSLPAFLAAVEHGYAIETDVRFTKDKKIVVFHDDDLRRMTGDPRPVSACTYAELSALVLRPGMQSDCTIDSPHDSAPAALLRHPERSEESPQMQSKTAHIPLFSEFLESVEGRVPLLIEIKNMPHVKGKEIAAAVRAHLKEYSGAYALQSFNPLYVKACKKLFPDIPCGVLGTAEKGAAKGFQRYIIKHMPLNFWVKPAFISYCKEDLPRGKIKRFKGTKLAWVVRSEEEERAARKYVNNIIFEDFLP